MTRSAEMAMWALTTVFIAAAAAGWRYGPAAMEPSQVTQPVGSAAPQIESPSRLTTLASSIVQRNPFRLDRKPANLPFSSVPMTLPARTVARRPALALSGIFGPPWQAVLEGVPGREGSVVARTGDTFGDLHVRSIRPDTVVVQGADTTWKLTVRRVW